MCIFLPRTVWRQTGDEKVFLFFGKMMNLYWAVMGNILKSCLKMQLSVILKNNKFSVYTHHIDIQRHAWYLAHHCGCEDTTICSRHCDIGRFASRIEVWVSVRQDKGLGMAMMAIEPVQDALEAEINMNGAEIGIIKRQVTCS